MRLNEPLHKYATWPAGWPYLISVLLVDVDDLLHLVVAAHEDARPVVNRLWHHLKHPLHLTVDGLTTS